MAEALMFQYHPGSSALHRSDIRIKLAAMIGLSLLLIHVSIFRLLYLLPFLLILQKTVSKESPGVSIPPLLFLMPAIIFSGNFISLLRTDVLLSQSIHTAGLRTMRFIYILWMAQLFTLSSDPMTITPALYNILKHIPLLPAGRISTQMGLSLTLIPIILDEMSEIRDAMSSRCGWNKKRPIRNLIHLGLPLLNGVLTKAEALSDAMESRLYREDATEPENPGISMSIIPLLTVVLLITLLLVSESLFRNNPAVQRLFDFY